MGSYKLYLETTFVNDVDSSGSTTVRMLIYDGLVDSQVIFTQYISVKSFDKDAISRMNKRGTSILLEGSLSRPEPSLNILILYRKQLQVYTMVLLRSICQSAP